MNNEIFDNMSTDKAMKLRYAYQKAAKDITKAKVSLLPITLETTRTQLFETFTTIKKLDSVKTLFWIMSKKERKIYGAKRVRVIICKTDKNYWNYISGIDNPADLGSRGMKAVE